MFTFESPPANIKLILLGLIFTVIVSYTISSFLQENEISDPTVYSSPKTIFHLSGKTGPSAKDKQFVHDSSIDSFRNKHISTSYRQSEAKWVESHPQPNQQKGLSNKQISEAQAEADEIYQDNNLENTFWKQENLKLKRKSQRKRASYRYKRMKSGYPDPFRKRKKRKKKTNEQIMQKTYHQYLSEKGQTVFNKYLGPAKTR